MDPREEALGATFWHARDAIFWVDPASGTLTNCNPAAAALLGRPREEIAGKSFLFMHRPPERAAIEVLFRNHVEAGGSIEKELEVVSADGESRYVDIHSTLVHLHGTSTLLAIFHDVTERRAAMRALSESEANFRALAENAGEAILITPDEGTCVYANRCAVELSGYSAAELAGMTSHELIVPRDRAKIEEITRDRLAGKSIPSPYETAIVTRTGHEVPVEVSGAMTSWEGRPCTLAMMHDISERKRALAELHDSRQLLSVAQQLANAGSWSWNMNTGRLIWSEHMYALYGVTPESFIPTLDSVLEFFIPEDRTKLERLREQTRNGESGGPVELRTRAADGEVRHFLAQAVAIDDGSGAASRAVGSIIDITDRRRLERDILEVSNMEKQRIGESLHDALGQQLSGIAYLAKALEQSLRADGHPDWEKASQVGDLVRGALSQSRDIAYGLSPVDIREAGLPSALRRLVDATREFYGVACRYNLRAPVAVHDPAVEINLYHVAQEAITNAVQHGTPTRVTVRLSVGKTRGRLVVTDNGSGFPEGREESHGMGLRIMRHRAEMIGGALSVEPAEAGGVTVVCTFENRHPQ